MAAITEQGADAAILCAARGLRLNMIAAQATELIDQAEREQVSYRQFLADSLPVEHERLVERRQQRRIHDARFPRMKHLGEFDTTNTAIGPEQIATLNRGDWISRGEPLVLLGDSGTGKSHLLIGAGVAACEQGRRVRYVTCAALVNELAEAQHELALTQLVKRYARFDLLCVDELGYVHIDNRGAELLFQILTEREERASVAIATNHPFSEWGATFNDPRLAAAVVDRITFNAIIINTGTTSWRLNHTKTKKGTKPKPHPQ